MGMADDAADETPGCDTKLPEQVANELGSRPVDTEIEQFSALANETRYRILLLARAADGGVCGCELEPHLDVKQSSISQSLTRLRKAGLLSRTKQGRWRYYDTTEVAEELLSLTESDEKPSQPIA